jgi:hypothetical protein
MLRRLQEFFFGRVSAGDRLGEAFYGVWMAVISIGLINSVTAITPDHVMFVVAVTVGVNFVWGIIDGVTVMYSGVIACAERDALAYALRTRKDDAEIRDRMREQIEQFFGQHIDDAEKDRIIGAVASATPGENPATRGYRPGREDWLFALSILTIDVALAVPVAAPLLIIPDLPVAIYVSRLIAMVIFAALGWGYAKRLNRNPWIASIALGLLGFAVFTAAFEAGW